MLKQEQNAECFICLGQLTDDVCPNVCPEKRHTYHKKCLDRWYQNININNRIGCPACKLFQREAKAKTYCSPINNDDDFPEWDSTKLAFRKCEVCHESYNVYDRDECYHHFHSEKRKYDIPITIRIIQMKDKIDMPICTETYEKVNRLKKRIILKANEAHPVPSDLLSELISGDNFSRIRLIHGGRELADDNALVKSYGVCKDSIIYMVISNRMLSSASIRDVEPLKIWHNPPNPSRLLNGSFGSVISNSSESNSRQAPSSTVISANSTVNSANSTGNSANSTSNSHDTQTAQSSSFSNYSPIKNTINRNKIRDFYNSYIA